MKIKVKYLLATMMFLLLLAFGTAMAGEVTPEFFLYEMTPDAQEAYLEQTGLSYELAAGLPTGIEDPSDIEMVYCDACGGWYEAGNVFRNHICNSYDPTDVEMVPCSVCGDWFEAGAMFRNHVCIPSNTNTNSNSSSSSRINGKTNRTDDAYYDALVNGQLNGDTVVAQGTIYVNTANGKSLKMRNRPGTHGDVITNLPNGTSLTLFWYENSSWAFVSYRGYFGFCMTRHLSDTPGTPNTPSSSKTNEATMASGTDANLNSIFKGFKYVNYYAAVKPSNPSGFVNLRWAPTKAAPVQDIFYADEVFKVVATNGTWSQIVNETTGVSGFMMTSFLNKIVD